MKVDIKHLGRKINRDRSLKTLLKGPGVMASGISTIFSREILNDV